MSYVESKEQTRTNKQTNKQAHRYREHFDGCQIVPQGAWRRGLRGTNWQLQNSHWDADFSMENIVSSIVITMYGVRWVLDLSESSKKEQQKQAHIYRKHFDVTDWGMGRHEKGGED